MLVEDLKVNLINILIDQDIISGKDLINIKKICRRTKISTRCNF